MAPVPSTTTTTTKALIQRTITIGPGECVVLPDDAIVKSIITTGAISVTSSCGALPAPSGYKCGVFYFNIDDDLNKNHPMDEDSTYVETIKVGTNIYPIHLLAKDITEGTDGGTALNVFLPNTGAFAFTYLNRFGINDDDSPKRFAIYIYFKIAPELWSTVMLGVSSEYETRSTLQYYLPHDEVVCDTYTDY